MKKLFLSLFVLFVQLGVSSASGPKYVALTFDDGPSVTVTPQILDLLELHGVTATFFVRGNRVEGEAAQVMQRAHSMGCEIGNHSWSHPHFSKKAEDRIKWEIDTASAVIEKYVGVAPRFLRPPFYDWDERVAAATDMTLIGGYCPEDYKDETSVQRRIDLTLENVKDGQILLFHDSSKNQKTVDALKTIIPELIGRGYTFVTVSDLFRLRCPDGKWEHNAIYHDLPAAVSAMDSLKVRFIGTGAADWNGPDERGEHRRLTSVLLDDRILIDLTRSDLDMIPEGVKPEAIFYTHSHSDHYDPAVAAGLGIPKAYVSATWHGRALREFDEESSGRVLVIPMQTGEKVVCGDISITALPANHAAGSMDEQTLIYLVEKGAVRLLYATDTGGIPVWAARIAGIDMHAKIHPITAFIMEATMGLDCDEDFRIFAHSSVGTVLRTTHVLLKTGAYTPQEGQKVYLTHMARTLHGTQAELDRDLPSPLAAAYDGLEVVFKAEKQKR